MPRPGVRAARHRGIDRRHYRAPNCAVALLGDAAVGRSDDGRDPAGRAPSRRRRRRGRGAFRVCTSGDLVGLLLPAMLSMTVLAVLETGTTTSTLQDVSGQRGGGSRDLMVVALANIVRRIVRRARSHRQPERQHR